jgi:hypothetical protein
LTYDPAGPLPEIGIPSEGGIYLAMGDGSVQGIKKGKSETILRGLITRNGGEKLPKDWLD